MECIDEYHHIRDRTKLSKHSTLAKFKVGIEDTWAIPLYGITQTIMPSNIVFIQNGVQK
jgi:hypothetical protein